KKVDDLLGEIRAELLKAANFLEEDEGRKTAQVSRPIAPPVVASGRGKATRGGKKAARQVRAGQSEPGRKKRGYIDPKSNERDKWIYENLCNQGRKMTCVLNELNNTLVGQKGWEPVSTINGLKDRAKAYARRENLDPPPKRRGA